MADTLDFGDWSARDGTDGSFGDFSPRSSSGSDGSLFGSGFGASAKGIAGGISGLVGGFFDSKAASAQAESYHQAAKQGNEIANLEEESTAISQYQEARKVSKTLGQIRATEASNGFGEGGSGMYILQDSQRQGAIANAKIGIQGQIQVDAARMAANKAEGEAKAAEAGSSKSMFGGIMSAVSSIAGLL